jgi:hypothetical protein
VVEFRRSKIYPLRELGSRLARTNFSAKLSLPSVYE